MSLEEPEVSILRLDQDLPMPQYAHDGDAGADIYARERAVLEPGERRLVPTGIALAMPEGWAAFVHPRSGLAARSGITIVNAPGTVDAGFRGEIRVCLLNTDSHRRVILERGDRIAQLVFQRIGRAKLVGVAELPSSERSEGGHGSTGGISAWLPQPDAGDTIEEKNE